MPAALPQNGAHAGTVSRVGCKSGSVEAMGSPEGWGEVGRSKRGNQKGVRGMGTRHRALRTLHAAQMGPGTTLRSTYLPASAAGSTSKHRPALLPPWLAGQVLIGVLARWCISRGWVSLGQSGSGSDFGPDGGGILLGKLAMEHVCWWKGRRGEAACGCQAYMQSARRAEARRSCGTRTASSTAPQAARPTHMGAASWQGRRRSTCSASLERAEAAAASAPAGSGVALAAGGATGRLAMPPGGSRPRRTLTSPWAACPSPCAWGCPPCTGRTPCGPRTLGP